MPALPHILLPTLLLLLPVLATTNSPKPQAQCYYPPHGNNPDSPFPQPADTPCNPSRAHPSANPPTHSPCCAPEDICLANGLCYRPDINRLHRGSCTDPTFAAPACSKACTAPGTHQAGWADVLECTGADGGRGRGRGNWYCGLGNSSACERGMTFRLGDGFIADFRGGKGGRGGDGDGKGMVEGSGKGGDGSKGEDGGANGEGNSEESEPAMTVTTTEAVASTSTPSSSSISATASGSGNATVSASGTSAPAASATNGADRVLGQVGGMAMMRLLGVAAAFVVGL